MVTNNVGVGGVKFPTGLFNVSTFGTLGGCASVTFLVAGVLSGMFSLEIKIVGLVVSIIVAYVAVFLSRGVDRRRYVVAFFNGFLIYFTVVGATALTPLVNTETAEAAKEDSPGIVENLKTPWFPDNNMVNRKMELEDEVTSLNQTKIKLTADIENLNTINDNLSNEVTNLNETKIELDDQVWELTILKGNLDEQIERLDRTKERLENQVESLTETNKKQFSAIDNVKYALEDTDPSDPTSTFIDKLKPETKNIIGLTILEP